MSYHYLGEEETDQQRARRLQDEARARKQSLEDQALARRQGQEDAEQARQDAVAAQASAYAHGPSTVRNVDYMSYLNQGQNYMKVPGQRGAVSRAAGGIGQGLLIFGVLAGGLFAMFMLFYMMKPKTMQQMSYGYGYKKKRKK